MRRLFALFLAGGCLFAAILFAMGAARAEKCADAVWQNPVLIWRNRFLRRTHRISQKVQYLRHGGKLLTRQ